MARAATGSAHHQPSSAFSAKTGQRHRGEVPARTRLLGVGDQRSTAQGLAGLALGPCQPQHHTDRDSRQDDADRARLRGLRRQQRAHRFDTDVHGQDQEGHADQPLRTSFDTLDPVLIEVPALLGTKAPDEHDARDGLDDAVDTEGDERDRAAGDAREDRDEPLEDVPADGQILEQ